MKFAYTILYVENVNHTVTFYEQAFGLEKRFIHESGQYAEMETGGTTLSFTSNELAKSNLPEGFQKNDLAHLPAGIEIAFTTDDVLAAFSRAVKAGATQVAKLQMKPWGQQGNPGCKATIEALGAASRLRQGFGWDSGGDCFPS